MTTAERLDDLRTKVAAAWAAVGAENATPRDPRTYSPATLWRAERLQAELLDLERATAGAVVMAVCSTCREEDRCHVCNCGAWVCEHCDFGQDAAVRCRSCARGAALVARGWRAA